LDQPQPPLGSRLRALRSNHAAFVRSPLTFYAPQKADKEGSDARVERSLYQRANGYSYETVKIFCDKNGKVTRVPYVEHVAPDVTACIFWLENRKPNEWRDVQQMQHVLGKYIISDKADDRGGMD
jgi:hypothetical protein